MRRVTLSLMACAIVALGHVPARGQLIAACRGDVQRFCADIPLGGGRIAHCLAENAAKLSKACQEAIAASDAPGGAGAGGDAQTACRGDAMRLCADAIGDQEKMQHCLQSHAAQLSDGCKTAIIAGGGK